MVKQLNIIDNRKDESVTFRELPVGEFFELANSLYLKVTDSSSFKNVFDFDNSCLVGVNPDTIIIPIFQIDITIKR